MMNQISKKSVLFSYYKLFFIGIVALFVFFSASFAHAVTPTLSLSSTGDGDTVQLSIYGDANSNVLLFYVKTGSNQQQIKSVGTTNSSGVLTTTISSSQNGIVSGSPVHVVLGSMNGSQSSNVSWPTVSALISSTNMISLSQTGLVLPIGQTATVTASNLGTSSIYLSNNSNPMIANINISGSQITVLGSSYGSTVATVCLISNSSNCSSIYVTVQNSSAQPLTFSQSSVSMYSGQSIAIQITGGSGSYFVTNNTSQNNGVVQTSMSGSTVTLTTSSTTGSSSITVCSTDNISCGIINVNFGSVGNNTSAISFSQTSPTVILGQTLNISIYGPSSSLLYVSSNSNPSIVQPNISGTTLTLLGITSGTSTLSICAAANNCGTLTVTVNYGSGNSNTVYPVLSQSSVSLAVGQISNITISGGAMPYTILSGSNNIFLATLNVNLLTLTGISVGSQSMNVCSAGGSCITLPVTVTNISSAVVLPAGCLSTVGYSQTTGLSCNTTVTTATNTTPVGCTSATEYSPITGKYCGYVSTPTTSTPTSSVFKFTKAIKLGSKGTEVSELQKKLKTLGFFTANVNGVFGPATEKAVKAFQKKHKLAQLGSVGPGTRALLNK